MSGILSPDDWELLFDDAVNPDGDILDSELKLLRAHDAALRESNRLLQTALDDQRESLAVAEEERDALMRASHHMEMHSAGAEALIVAAEARVEILTAERDAAKGEWTFYRGLYDKVVAERDRYRAALEEIAAECDCERRGLGEGAHWASCSSLCGTAPARARKALAS